LAIADDEQAQVQKILLPVINTREREHKGGGQLQQCELLRDEVGLKSSIAVLLLYCMPHCHDL